MLRRLLAFYGLQVRLLWQWRPGRWALVRRGLVTFGVAFAAFSITIWLLPGIRSASPGQTALAVVVLGLLNALVRPILLALFAPISIVLIGLATVVFQVVAILAVGWFVAGIEVDGPVTAFAGSWLFAILSLTLTSLFSIDRDESYWGALVRGLAARRRDAIHSEVPGLVIVQLDGVAHPVLLHQVRAGRVPTMSRWIRDGSMRLERWSTLLPSGTPASQAGILFGRSDLVPAFRWWDKASGRLVVCNRPRDAAALERALAAAGPGLLAADGASIGNLLSGGAARSYITMATISDPTQGLGRSQGFFAFFVSPYNYLHTIVLSLGEVLKEVVQARRASRRGITPRLARGFPYPLARAATNVALRALSTSLVLEEMYRGTPVIYVDYTDYDEVAHYSGPERAEALDALDGLDRTLGSLERAARDTPRPYRFVVLSDHGQSLGATFRQRYGRSLEDVVHGLLTAARAAHPDGGRPVAIGDGSVGPAEMWGPVNAAITEAAQAGGATGAITRTAFRGRTTADGIDLSARDGQAAGPRAADADTGPAPTVPHPGSLPEVVVAASGNLAHVAFPRIAGRATLEQLDVAWPGLVPGLAEHPGIGLVLVRSLAEGALALGPAGRHALATGEVAGADPLEPYGRHALAALRRLDAMAACGDVVLLSRVDPATDEVAAFEELIGSHGGLGGAQSEAFLLHPAAWRVPERLVGADALHRLLVRWLQADDAAAAEGAPTPRAEGGPGAPMA